MEKKRNSNFELLRIVSMILIVSFHFILKNGVTYEVLSKDKYIHDIFMMFGELGVNLFVLITGYFMVQGKFKINKLIRLLLEVWFYNFVSLLIINQFSVYQLLQNIKIWDMFPNIYGVYWFTTAYILLYILSPYLNKLILSLKKSEMESMLIIFILLWSIIPSIFGTRYGDTEGMLFYNRFIWMILVYFVGAYIRIYSDENKFLNLPFNVYATGSLIMFGMIMLVILFLEYYPIISPIYFWQPNSIVVFSWSLIVFLAFKNIKMSSHRYINKIASLSLGIYLFHDGHMAYFLWNCLNSILNSITDILLFKIILAVFFVFLLGGALELFRQFLEEIFISLLNKIEWRNSMIIKKYGILSIILAIFFAVSSALLSFYNMIVYNKLLVLLTICCSFIVAFLFFLKTKDKQWKNFLNKPSLFVFSLVIALIIAYEFNLEKALRLYGTASINLFRIRYILMALPSLIYLLFYFFVKLKEMLVSFLDSLNDWDKKAWLYISLIVIGIILLIFTRSDIFYNSNDKIYSIDARYCLNEIFPRSDYYDIRHPLLSLITFPIYAVLKFISVILFPMQLQNVAIALLLQVVNVQCLILIGLMLKKMLNDSKFVFLIYICSYPTLLFFLFLEKYQICTFLLVLYIYYAWKKVETSNCFVISSGVMPTSGFMILLEFFSNDNIKDAFKKIVKIIYKGVILIFISGRINILAYGISDIKYQLNYFGSNSLGITERIVSFFNMVVGSFLSLSSTTGEVYIWNDLGSNFNWLFFGIILIVIVGFYKNRTLLIAKSSLLWLIFSFILIVLFNWSSHESPLFSIYFSWAIILLFSLGLKEIIKCFKLDEMKIKMPFIFALIIVNSVGILDLIFYSLNL